MNHRVRIWLVRSAVLAICAICALGAWLGRAAPALAQSGITSPAPGSALSTDVPVMGTATIEPFQKYELHFKLEPSGDDAFVYFDGGTTQVNNGQLGVWRAAGLAPGVYTLRLRVVKQDGNYAEFFAPNLSVNQSGATPTPNASLTPTASVTATTPTPTFTPAATPTPAIGAVQQPQLGQADATVAPSGAALAAAQPAAGAPAAALTAPVQAGDLAPLQASAVTTAGTTAEPTPASSSTRALGEALSLNRLRAQLYRGMRFSAALFLLALAAYSGKRIFDWARRRFG